VRKDEARLIDREEDDTLVNEGFWRSLSLGSENGQNKAPKLNSPSLPLPTSPALTNPHPTPQELSLGALF